MALAIVIEDDLSLRTLFGKALEKAGFKVLLAASAPDALTLLAVHNPDIAFIDVNMPAGLDTEVLHYLKITPRLAHVKTVVVTTNTQAASRAEELGADLFLLKPVSIVEMLMLANRLLGRSPNLPVD